MKSVLIRAHDLGVLPWNEANKIPTMSHYLQENNVFASTFIEICGQGLKDAQMGSKNYSFDQL